MMIIDFIIALMAYDLLKLLFSSMVNVWVKSKDTEAYKKLVEDKKQFDKKFDTAYERLMDSN